MSLIDIVRATFLVALPHGGQRAARTNAWAAMAADAHRARARREAAVAFSVSADRTADRDLAAVSGA